MAATEAAILRSEMLEQVLQEDVEEELKGFLKGDGEGDWGQRRILEQLLLLLAPSALIDLVSFTACDPVPAIPLLLIHQRTTHGSKRDMDKDDPEALQSGPLGEQKGETRWMCQQQQQQQEATDGMPIEPRGYISKTCVTQAMKKQRMTATCLYHMEESPRKS